MAVTKQKQDFEMLNENDILGVLQTRRTKEKKLEIENLQVSPTANYNAINRDFMKIGSALLDSVKQIFSDKEIFVTVKEGTTPFYKKNGFININKKNMIFRR